jgi:hypothetical protein
VEEITFIDSKGEMYVLLQGDSEGGVAWLYSLVFFLSSIFLFFPLLPMLEWIIPIYRG